MTTITNRTFFAVNLAVSSVAILFLVWLIYARQTLPTTQINLDFLPIVNACLNGLSAISLGFGGYFIKTGRKDLHRNSMISAFLFSALFLVSYIIYHALHGDTKFLAGGTIHSVYMFILASHIILSVITLPLIFGAFFFALTSRLANHKKIIRFVYPLWMYVSVTGVVIVVMLKAFNT